MISHRVQSTYHKNINITQLLAKKRLFSTLFARLARAIDWYWCGQWLKAREYKIDNTTDEHTEGIENKHDSTKNKKVLRMQDELLHAVFLTTQCKIHILNGMIIIVH